MHYIVDREQRRVGLCGDIHFPFAAVWPLELKPVARTVDRVTLTDWRTGSYDRRTRLDTTLTNWRKEMDLLYRAHADLVCNLSQKSLCCFNHSVHRTACRDLSFRVQTKYVHEILCVGYHAERLMRPAVLQFAHYKL